MTETDNTTEVLEVASIAGHILGSLTLKNPKKVKNI